MKRFRTKKIVCILLILISLHYAGCGTILYPERRGQTGGEVDPAVIVMDGLLLFVAIIPGVVAFAVDLTTGAIYKPSKRVEASTLDRHKFLEPVEESVSRHEKEWVQKRLRDTNGSNMVVSEYRHYRLRQGETPAQFFCKEGYLETTQFR